MPAKKQKTCSAARFGVLLYTAIASASSSQTGNDENTLRRSIRPKIFCHQIVRLIGRLSSYFAKKPRKMPAKIINRLCIPLLDGFSSSLGSRISWNRLSILKKHPFLFRLFCFPGRLFSLLKECPKTFGHSFLCFYRVLIPIVARGYNINAGIQDIRHHHRTRLAALFQHSIMQNFQTLF